MKSDDVGLAFGALLGAGVFLTTVVVGAVCMCGSFHLMERPFLRDLVFYLITVFFTFFICYDREINLTESLGYIVGYVVYVIVVIVGRVVYQYRKRTSAQSPGTINNLGAVMTDEVEEDHVESAAAAVEHTEYHIHSGEIQRLILPASVSDVTRSLYLEFLYAISPVDMDRWKNGSCIHRACAVFKAPALFVIKLTVPVVDYSLPRHNWNKHLSIAHCIITPVFSIFAANPQIALQCIAGSQFRVCYVFLIVGVCLAVIVARTSERAQPPIYHWVFAYVAFLAAVLWIKTIANEIVNLLQTGGVVFSISNAVLGLTFLAWGNSIGDFIADVTMAKRGYPRTGISACFGGPLFNTLIGIGVPFTLKILAGGGNPIGVSFNLIQIVLFAGLAASLISTLVIVPLLRFNMNRIYGLYLLSMYVVFLVLALLVETNVIG